MDRVSLFDVRKQCRVCGRRYPMTSGQQCSCCGFLYVTGAYWQRKVGDAGGQGGADTVLRDDGRDKGYTEADKEPG